MAGSPGTPPRKSGSGDDRPDPATGATDMRGDRGSDERQVTAREWSLCCRADEVA
jgi:hypothetical protein